MTERPILFSAPMVRAILDGRKTQTRRILTVPWKGSTRALPYEPYWVESDGRLLCCDEYGDYHDVEKTRACPHGEVGDRLWVREGWAVGRRWDDASPCAIPSNLPAMDDLPSGRMLPAPVWYRADVERDPAEESWANRGRWRPSIFMPRWASRLTLEIAEVRVERLQSISEEDARAEGVEPAGGFMTTCGCWQNYASDGPSKNTARESFASLWDRINGTREGCAWADSPWVWALTLRRVEGGR